MPKPNNGKDNMKSTLYALFLLFAQLSYSQEAKSDFSYVDKRVAETKEEFTSYRDLAMGLTAHWEREDEKIRAIYFWIISNIDYYDQININTNDAIRIGINSVESEATFKKRMGKCTGYSSLFESMCNAVNLECYAIFGYAIDAHPCQIEEFSFYDHMWNCCRIDGRWCLMDLTWDSNTWRHTQSVDSLAFLVEPSKFIEDHIPANPMWQLLDRPVSISSLCKVDHSTLHQNEEIYSYNDSIIKWKRLPDIDKRVFDRYQCYTFNPIMCQPYGAALMEKGLDVAFGKSTNTDSLYINMDNGRDILVESLLYLKPYQVYINEDDYYFIKNDNVTSLKKRVLKTIRLIEKATLKMIKI